MTLIRYYGHVGVPSGYGVAAAETCMAILSAGFDLEISTDGTQLPKRFLPLASCVRDRDRLSRPDVVVIHTLPLDCGRVLSAERIREVWPDVPCIAYTTWEGNSIVPDEIVGALEAFHMVWVPSWNNMRRFRGNPLTVARVPHAFDPADNVPSLPRDADGEFRFYYIGAWNLRKNVDGLVRTFVHCFSQAPLEARKPCLHIHSPGASQATLRRVLLSTGIPEDKLPRVVLTTDYLSDAALSRVHQASDCFVTASRGEAWNLPAFDAVRHGRHVIAPQCHGSDDFLDALDLRYGTSAELYKSVPQPAQLEVVDIAPGEIAIRGPQGLDARATWREPDLLELAGCMRRAYTLNATSLATGYDLVAEFGREAVGARIRTLIEGATL